MALNTVSFGFAAWQPKFFVKKGFTISASLGFNTLMSLGKARSARWSASGSATE
jgi:hypothetical protein